MGTRNLTVVFMDGKYRVAQYGQWDGYPEGQGMVCLEFLQTMFVEYTFRRNLEKLKFIQTQEELDAINTLYPHCPPEVNRDTGAKILKLIQKGEIESGCLVNNIGFAVDKSGFDCEWCYVIDLDSRTFEVYDGYHDDPLTEFDRFYFLVKHRKESEHFGVKLVASWDLGHLPTKEEFIKRFSDDEEE